MLKSVCPHYCPVPFCLVVCPAGAITTAVKGKTRSICLDMDRCNGCGICRVMCMTWSLDKTMAKKLPWVSSRTD